MKRDVVADLKWGVRRGLIFTALLLVPAVLALLADLGRGGSNLLVIMFAYLIFGAASGTLLGYFRPLLKRRGGASVLGAAIGGVGVVLLMFAAPATAGHPDWGLVEVSGVVGAIFGAGLGWTLAKRAAYWRDVAKRRSERQ